MRFLPIVVFVALNGCGQVAVTDDDQSPSPTKARYFACVENHGKAIGHRDQLSYEQAAELTERCGALLRPAALEIAEKNSRGLDTAKIKDSRVRRAFDVGFIEGQLKNEAMRRISDDVLALPEV